MAVRRRRATSARKPAAVPKRAAAREPAPARKPTSAPKPAARARPTRDYHPAARTTRKSCVTPAATPAVSIPAVRGDVEIEVGGRRVRLTNLDKVFFQEIGATTRDL